MKLYDATPGGGEEPSPFVFPEAARRYNYKTDKGVYSLQGHLYRGVKPFIGMAVDDGATDVEPAALIDDEAGTPDPEKVVAAINAAPFAAKKTERLIAEYKLFAGGKSMRFGKRAACVYGWHSFRTAFVVMAVDAGVPVAKVRAIVGHADTKMTLDYYRPTKAHEAERVRQQMRGTVLGEGEGHTTIGETMDADTAAVVPAKPSVDAFIEGLTEEQRKELARKLLGL